MARRATIPDTCDLLLTIRGDRYRIRPIRGEGDRGWRLRKLGTDLVYRVVEHSAGPLCSCGDWTYRPEVRGSGRKHVRAMVALGLVGGGWTLETAIRRW